MTRNVQLKQTLELDEWASSVGVSETDKQTNVPIVPTIAHTLTGDSIL